MTATVKKKQEYPMRVVSSVPIVSLVDFFWINYAPTQNKTDPTPQKNHKEKKRQKYNRNPQPANQPQTK